MALPWTIASMPMSVLHWGTQNWTQYPRCGLSSVEGKGREGSPPATCWRHPGYCLPFCSNGTLLVFDLEPTRTAGSFLQSCFPAGWTPAQAGAWNCPPQVRVFTLPLPELHEVQLITACPPISPAFGGPSKQQYDPLVYPLLFPVLYHQQTCRAYTLPCHPDHCWRCWTGLDAAVRDQFYLSSFVLLDTPPAPPTVLSVQL